MCDSDDLGYSRGFYEKMYTGATYASAKAEGEHAKLESLLSFVKKRELCNKWVLEIGCGRGAFQDLVEDYVGIDIAEKCGAYLHKPFFCTSANRLPFADETFDAIWSVWVLEHVPKPEKALIEMRRVLKPGGFLHLDAGWQCRPWYAEGFPVRPYSDFDWKGKCKKATIPVRNSVLFRSFYVFPRRLARHSLLLLLRKPTPFRYRQLDANYECFWMPDSDACNSMDPHEVILWFASRGDECLSHPGHVKSFVVRTGALEFRKHRNAIVLW